MPQQISATVGFPLGIPAGPTPSQPCQVPAGSGPADDLGGACLARPAGSREWKRLDFGASSIWLRFRTLALWGLEGGHLTT